MRRSDFPSIGEQELVLGALLGDLEAFDELVRRFRGAVVAIAEQETGSRAAAEDVAQDAFLLAFKALPQLDEPARFAGWLCAITRHRARRVATREGRSEATERSELDRLILEHSEELSVHPAEDVAREAEHAEVREALAKLPPEHQDVLWLYYYEQWSVQQIGDFLSLPITTVKWRLHHGRELMRRRLDPTREERRDERDTHQHQRHRNSEAAAPPARDHQDLARKQPDRRPQERRAHFDPHLQLGAGAPGARG